MASSLIRAQLNRAGFSLAGVPVISGTFVALSGWLAAGKWPSAQAMTLASWLAQIFIICVGVAAAATLTGDPLIELHEATQTSFRTVQTVRTTIVLVSGAIGAVIMFVPLHLLGIWPRDEGWITIISPVGAVVLVVVAAMFTAAFAGTTSATTIAVIAVWIFLSMLWDPYVLNVLVQRGFPLLGALILAAIGWQRLGDSERNIRKVAAI